MTSYATVAGASGKASIASAQVESCESLSQPGRPDDGRTQALRSSGNDLPAPMDVMTALRDGGDMSISLPSLVDVYAFLRARYLHSRFEGSGSVKDFPDYAQTVAGSSLEQLLETGLGCISMYESNTGRVIWFDRALRVLNPDEAPAQIQAKAGNLTHIYGQAMS